MDSFGSPSRLKYGMRTVDGETRKYGINDGKNFIRCLQAPPPWFSPSRAKSGRGERGKAKSEHCVVKATGKIRFTTLSLKLNPRLSLNACMVVMFYFNVFGNEVGIVNKFFGHIAPGNNHVEV